VPTPPDDAFVNQISDEEIEDLAALYDGFANALDPFSPDRDQCELLFNQEVAGYFDMLQEVARENPELRSNQSFDLHTFRKKVIQVCKRRLRAGGRQYPTLAP
jgi:hypothetical protein